MIFRYLVIWVSSGHTLLIAINRMMGRSISQYFAKKSDPKFIISHDFGAAADDDDLLMTW